MQAIRLRQARDALPVNLESILCSDGRKRARFGRTGLPKELHHFLEVPLEPRRRDQLENARLLVAVVPKGVLLAPWLEDQVARLPVHDLITE
jgi:hypothetical protein